MNYRPVLDIVVPAAIVGGAFVILSFVACSGQSVEAKQAEAEAKYGAAQLDCVADAGALADSKACRARVDAEYKVKPRVNVPPAMFVPPEGGAR